MDESQDGVNDDETENNVEVESDQDEKEGDSTHEDSDTETDKGFNKFDEVQDEEVAES